MAEERKKRVEFGTLKWTMEIKDGRPTLHMQVLQDNYAEAAPLVPDGKYSWIMVMDLDTAEKSE